MFTEFVLGFISLNGLGHTTEIFVQTDIACKVDHYQLFHRQILEIDKSTEWMISTKNVLLLSSLQ